MLVAWGVTLHVPASASLPAQFPDAAQAAALLDDQLSTLRAPGASEAGFAAIVSVGTGEVTATVTDLLGRPAHPNVYVVVTFGDTVSDPEFDTVPNQPPEAVQEAGEAEDHLSVLLPPATIEAGLAVNAAPGVGGTDAGGGSTVTVTDTDDEVLSEFEHVSI